MIDEEKETLRRELNIPPEGDQPQGLTDAQIVLFGVSVVLFVLSVLLHFLKD